MSKRASIAGSLGLAILILAALVVVRRPWRASDGEDDPDAVAPESQGRDVRTAAIPAVPPQANGGLDLLGLLDLGQYTVAGRWGFQGPSLVSCFTPWGRIQAPCVPPAEYDLRLRVTRKRGAGSLGLGVLVDDTRGMIVLDGDDGCMSWVVRSGHPTSEGNDTARSTRALKWNKPATILVSVRKGQVVVAVEGKEILRWRGPAGDLAVPPQFVVPSPKALILGASEATFRIEEWTLIPVTGAPALLRKA